ncbi:MAG: hypothetical protein LQ340_003836 [Diploschistes diacapsis]|nr:MAG: hypothetical protein LQ340_003836 [Diploschistes diacapsis]
MQFKLIALASVLSLVSADLSQYIVDLESYAHSIAADPSAIALFSQMATLPNVQQSLLAAVEEAAATATAIDYFNTPPPEFSAFPSPYNSFLLSVWSAECAIAVKDGVITGGSGSAPSAPASAGTGMITSAASMASAAASGSTPSGSSSSASGASSASSKGGAAAPTGVVVMGALAGIVGMGAVLL